MRMADDVRKVGEVPDRATHIFHAYKNGVLHTVTWVQASHQSHVDEEVRLLKSCGHDRVDVTARRP